jgi:hypothetical protein
MMVEFDTGYSLEENEKEKKKQDKVLTFFYNISENISIFCLMMMVRIGK